MSVSLIHIPSGMLSRKLLKLHSSSSPQMEEVSAVSARDAVCV